MHRGNALLCDSLCPLWLDSSVARLRLERRLVDQHDGNIVLHRIDAMTLLALQALRILAVLEILFARRTNQNFQ
jgi:hypothetical protein